MDIPWGDERGKRFVTNVGLVTSRGPQGDNIMAAEWTHQISYRPALLAIHIGPNKTTYENIIAAGVFGVNIAASDQNVLSHLAGGHSGRQYDKIAIARDLGFSFREAKTIDALILEGAVVNFECRLQQALPFGDHVMLIGEVQEAELHEDKDPLIYHHHTYWKIGEHVHKPPEPELSALNDSLERHRKSA